MHRRSPHRTVLGVGWARKLTAGTLGGLLLGIGLALALAGPSAATTTILSVTKTADTSDGSCGVSNCSLRDAVIAANGITSSSANPVQINIPAGTYTLTLGELDLGAVGKTLNVILNGTTGNPSDVVIKQTGTPSANPFSVFLVGFDTSSAQFVTGQSTTFQNLTITGGIDSRATTGAAGGFGGGGIQAGGPSQSLTITNCVITGNQSVAGAGGGAGIFDGGANLTVSNSTFSNNISAAGFGGGIGLEETGDQGAASISNSTFTNNSSSVAGGSAGNGGGGAFLAGFITDASVSGSTFSNNTAGSYGGGLFIEAQNSATVTTSQFLNNTAGSNAQGQGAGVWIGSSNTLVPPGGAGSISLSTFSGNNASANGGGGGAIWNHIGPTTVAHNRIVANSATFGSGIVNDVNTGSVNASDNWWGHNTGPGAGTLAGTGTGSAPTATSWLQLRNVASPATVLPNGSATLSADLLGRNAGGALAAGSLNGLATFPASGPIFSNVVDGSLSGASSQFVNGTASATLNAGTTLGAAAAHADVTADSQTVTGDVNVVANSSTAVATSPNPTVFGQPVLFTATMTSASGPTTPSVPQGGTVQFKVDGTGIGSPAAVSSGGASASFSTLAVGSHSISAVYGGDTDFNGSTGTAVSQQVVNKAGTSVALGSSPNPSVVGGAVQFTATVTVVAPGAGTPGGTVQFFDGATSLGSGTMSGGVATLSTSALAVGTHGVTATYSGDPSFNPSTGGPLSQVVLRAPTTVTLGSSASPSVLGQGVTFTAAVTSTYAGTLTGSVQFGVDGANVGSPAPVSGGSAVLANLSSLAVGTHTVTATYSGDATFAPATGTLAGGQVVINASTATTLGSSKNPSPVGDALDFTATVTAVSPGSGTPTGTVQFVIDGSNVGAPQGLDGSGVATLSGISTLTIGSHPVNANYLGDTGFNPSSAAPLNQVVTGKPTTTTVTSSANPSVFGQPVSFTATVDSGGNGTPVGSVQFGVDGANVGSPVALDGSGVASSSALSTLAVGTHTVTATFGAGSGFAGSTGALAGGQTVNQASTTTGVTSSANPSVFGQPVTFTATVAPVGPGGGTPTGQVQFGVDGVNLGSPQALGGSGAAVSPPAGTLAVGSHTVTATYLGDPGFTGSHGSLPGGQTVNQADTTTIVTSSANPSVTGQPVTFTATVTPVAPGAGTPSVSVSFFVDGTLLETAPLSGGSATSTAITTLAVGTHTVTATYGGDASFNASTSPQLSQVVNAAANTTSLSSSANPSVFGQPVTFTATVAPVAPATGTPSGNVEFFVNGSSVGTGPLVSGSAVSPVVSTMPTGTDSVTATYSGDGNFAPSTGSTSQTVNQASSTSAITTSPDPSVFGETVTFDATVTAVAPGAGTPTGQVQFNVDGVTGTAINLAGGTASTTDAALTPGPHSVRVTYLGDANFAASVADVGHNVDLASTTTTVTSALNPSPFGHAVTFTATVTPVPPGGGTPSGSVQFFIDGSASGAPASLGASSTAVSAPVSSLAVGPHAVTATYSGATDFSPSTSGILTQVVGRIGATGAVTSSLNPSVFGQPVSFTVTLSGPQGLPTGDVQFGVDGVNLGTTVTVTGGVATSTAISTLGAGDHTVTATYSGDGTYLAGTFSTTQTVHPAGTSTSVSSSANPSVFSQAVHFTATVGALAPGAGTPTGQVQFTVDGSNLGSPVSLSGGQATSDDISDLSVGSAHTVTANFLGSVNFLPSSGSLPGGQGVNQADTSTSVSSSANPSVFGQAVHFTATVSPVPPATGNPSGSVQFVVDGSDFGSPVPLTGASASSQTTSSLAVGNHSVMAEFLGTTQWATSSGTLSGGQTVNKAATTTTVNSSLNPSLAGTPVTFTATVVSASPGAGTPAGTVQFMVDGSAFEAPVALTGGVAALQVGPLSVGTHQIAAVYSGNASFSGSTGSLQGGQVVTPHSVADLTVAKFGPRRGTLGLPLIYTIVVKNRGPNSASSVEVTDQLPSGFSVVAVTTSQGSCATALPAVTCSLGGLANDASAAVTIAALPHAKGTFTNTASVKSSTGDPHPANNSASLTTRVTGFGYWLLASDGGVFSFGDAQFLGSTGGMTLNKPVVAMASTPDGLGYWLVAADGGLFAFGDAQFFGSMGGQHINSPIVGMASTPDGEGYWLVASDGGLFAFGDAGFFGSAGGQHINSPIVGMASTPDGQGYWLVASDGGLFAFGDAGFFGSAGGQQLPAPIVGMATTQDGQGYWLVGADGSVYAFGDAGSFGSLSGLALNSPIVGMAATSDGRGYWLVGSDGGVFGFGDAEFVGGTGGLHLNKPVIGMTP